MKVWNMTDYVADARDATAGIQRAIDECYLAGGGEVRVSAGDWYIGDVRLRSRVTLHLEKDAHLIGSRDLSDYDHILADTLEPIGDEHKTDVIWCPYAVRSEYERHHMSHRNKCLSTWNRAMLRAVDAHDIAIVCEEGSYIDGRDCYDERGEEEFRGPHAISAHRCEHLTFTGLDIRNSGHFGFVLFDCVDVRIERPRVSGGHDGVHMTTCTDVTICDGVFKTGDDCIAGVDNQNLLVLRCYLNSACSAFRLGGTDVLVEDTAIVGPGEYMHRMTLSKTDQINGTVTPEDAHKHRRNMLNAYMYYADYSRPIRKPGGNIRLRNCTVENATRFLEYDFSGNNPWQQNKPLLDISFENVKATGLKLPMMIYGDKDAPITVSFVDCDLAYAEPRVGDAPSGCVARVCHYRKLSFKNVTVRGLGAAAAVKAWNDGSDIVAGTLISDAEGERVVLTDGDFFKPDPERD
ncbi:MAG: right-handed parallel beta-helix repeat-containing protein [Clostridia bacterium]|nr:right-handed parallel beta-helix repeat-containing protein [Clostridia bacterium]